MNIGFAMSPAYDSIAPDRLGRAAEERDFRPLYFQEQTHIPASHDSGAPRGADLPEHYWKVLDRHA